MRTIVAFVAVLLLSVQAAAATDHVRLENDRLRLTLDKATGGIVELASKLDGQTYTFSDSAFDVKLGVDTTPDSLGHFSPGSCELRDVKLGAGSAQFLFEANGVRITLLYRLDPGDAFALKQLSIAQSGDRKFNVSRLHLFDYDLAQEPRKVIPYYGYRWRQQLEKLDDGQETAPSDNSTAYFLRFADGGVFTALTCDFVVMDKSPQGHYRSIYWPGQILEPDTVFTSEWGIIGIYQRKGPFHAPYQRREQLHDFLYPNVDVRLDRGEIDAVGAAVDKFLKPNPYFFMVNGWAMGLPNLIEDADDVRLYKQAIDTATEIPNIDALHFVHGLGGLAEKFRAQGLDLKIEPNPYVEEVLQYARDRKLGLSPFIGVSNNYPLQTAEPFLEKDLDLLVLHRNGKRADRSIALSRQYTSFLHETIVALNRRYPHIAGQTYDFLFFQPDYDPAHGYLPGRYSLYAQYALMREVNRRLRAKFPDLMLRGQIGWRELGPWFAEGMTFTHTSHDPGAQVHRNFLDFSIGYHFANNLRLSSWFANNTKMLPRHMLNDFIVANGSNFRAWDYAAWEYCILSRIASSVGFGMLNNLPDEEHGERWTPEALAFLDKWVKWQRAHADYYLRATELFGEPRPTGVDGIAYSSGRDAIVFLCNPTFRSHRVAVPISKDIQLPAGSAYTVKELYPEERHRFGTGDGTVEHGSNIVINVPSQTIVVLEIKPDDASKALVLGASGEASAGPDGILVTNLKGLVGDDRLVGVRLPGGYEGPEKLHINGASVPAARHGDALVARLGFEGEAYSSEIRDWTARRHGDGLRITAVLDVPRDCKEVLESQELPTSSAYAEQRWLDRTGWLGWGRFIIHLPIAPSGFEIDKLKGKQHLNIPKQFPMSATLNGKPVDLKPNIMGDGSRGQRWSGFFIDASDEITYGQKNELVIDLPTIQQEQFFGIAAPNLSRRFTGAFKAGQPPEALQLVEAVDAADPFIGKPQVVQEGSKHKVFLKLLVRGDSSRYLALSDVKADEGRITRAFVTGNDERWQVGPAGGDGKMLLGSSATSINLEVRGDNRTVINIGSGEQRLQLRLEQILNQWRENGDPFDPSVMEVPWPAVGGAVEVELSAPFQSKPTLAHGAPDA